MDKYLNSAKMAFKSMLANRLRTALTMLGIVIGVASVIVVYSAGEGIYDLLLSQVESFGTNIIETEIKVPSNKKGGEAETDNAMSLASGVQITTLKIEDLEDIKKLSNVSGGYAGVMSQDWVSYGGEIKRAFLFGASADYINIDRGELEAGRFFSEAEDKSLAQVAVLGSKVKDDLFGDSDAIGRFITVHKSKYQVIGVMEERGGSFGMNFDDYVFLPLRTLQKRIMGIDHVMYMVHQLYDPNRADETAAEAREILRDNHEISDPAKDDFRVVTMDEMMDMLNTITGALTILLLAIIIISLIVGGVGILNVMHVTVTERTSEIGLRKAVGAKYRDIIRQFLTESVVITLCGGLLGIIVGVLVSYGLAIGARRFGLDWHFSVPLKAFIVSLLFSSAFGIIFGLGPAKRAARLDPVEAMRKE
ncbi:MAG: ABC transporter permease [Patescibacteria group bacterium]